MNHVFFIVAVAIIAVASGGSRPQAASFKTLRLMLDQTCDPSGTSRKCFDDKSFDLCIYGMSYRANCPDDKPVCDKTTNDCVKRGITSNKCPATDGYFPDLDDCSIFYYCLGSQPTVYNCSAISNNSIYDPKTQSCIYGEASECQNATCADQTIGKLVAYPRDSTIYVVCGSQNNFLTVGRCPIYTTFNGTACAPTCLEEGRIRLNSTSFYDCVSKDENKKEFLQVPGNCPTGLNFDPVQKICVKP